jgi:hypothetical protein
MGLGSVGKRKVEFGMAGLRGFEGSENSSVPIVFVFLLDSISKLSNDRARSKRYIISTSSLVRLTSSRVQEQKPNESRRRIRHGGLLLLWVG